MERAYPTALLAFLLSCAHSSPTVQEGAKDLRWPTFVSPAESTIDGKVLEAARVALVDFAHPNETPPIMRAGEKCLSSYVGWRYAVVHDEAQHLFFVHLSPSDFCEVASLDLGADYAIDDTTWVIRGKRTAGEVAPRMGPRLAFLEITDCTTCSPPEPGGLPFVFGPIARPQDHTFYVQNIGEQEAKDVGSRGLADGLTFKGGSYPGTGGTCGASIGGGERCSIVVTFNPGASEESMTPVSLSYDDGFTRRTATRTVRGLGTPEAHLVILDVPGGNGNASINPREYDYGTAGIAQDHTFYVHNTGARAAASLADGGGLANNFAYKGGSYPGAGGTCGTALVSGERCTVVVTFTPSGSGPRSSTLTLAYQDGSERKTVSRGVAGTATLRAFLSITDFATPSDCREQCPPFDFGTVAVGTQVSHTFTVVNQGGAVTTTFQDGGGLPVPFGYPGGQFPGFVSTCGNIPPGEHCSIVIQFSPSTSGAYEDTVAIDYGDGLGPPLLAKRALRGTVW